MYNIFSVQNIIFIVHREEYSALDKTNSKNDYIRGFKDGIPVALGYIPIAMACGIATVQSGVSWLISQLMAFFVYSGAGQAATTNLIQGGETAIVMYALTLLVANCRYILLSMSLAQKLDPSINIFQKSIIGIFNTDETFGVAMKQKNITLSYFLGLATLPYFAFALGNFLGSIATNLLPDSISSALGIMIYAMFIAIIIPPAKESRSTCMVLIMALIMTVILECIPIVTKYLTPGWIIIICSIVTASIGAILFPVDDKNDEKNNTQNSTSQEVK